MLLKNLEMASMTTKTVKNSSHFLEYISVHIMNSHYFLLLGNGTFRIHNQFSVKSSTYVLPGNKSGHDRRHTKRRVTI